MKLVQPNYQYHGSADLGKKERFNLGKEVPCN